MLKFMRCDDSKVQGKCLDSKYPVQWKRATQIPSTECSLVCLSTLAGPAQFWLLRVWPSPYTRTQRAHGTVIFSNSLADEAAAAYTQPQWKQSNVIPCFWTFCKFWCVQGGDQAVQGTPKFPPLQGLAPVMMVVVLACLQRKVLLVSCRWCDTVKYTFWKGIWISTNPGVPASLSNSSTRLWSKILSTSSLLKGCILYRVLTLLLHKPRRYHDHVGLIFVTSWKLLPDRSGQGQGWSLPRTIASAVVSGACERAKWGQAFMYSCVMQAKDWCNLAFSMQHVHLQTHIRFCT